MSRHVQRPSDFEEGVRLQVRWLLVQVGVGYGIVWECEGRNAILDRDAEYYFRNLP
jgi:hypothetical protein